MKTKILSLLSLSVLALIMFAGMVSAAVVFTDTSNVTITSASANVNVGNTATVSFKANSTSNITLVTFNTPITMTSGSNTFTSAATVTNAVSSLTANVSSVTMSLTFAVSSEKANGTYNGILNLTADSVVYELPIALTVIRPNEPSEISACSLLSGVSGDLDVKIKDINIMSGFGDGSEDFWYPLDEIEVEIEVENNNGDEDMDDIEVKWGLYNVDKDDWVIDDEESDFNLKDGQDETMYITFELEDVDDFEDDDEYIFYVWANGELEDTNIAVCDFDSQDIEITNNDDFVILDDITYPSTASCGSEVQITADVWNVGDSDQDEVKVVIFNSELGINKIVEIGDINDFDNEFLDTFVEIPSDVEEKTYAISLKVYDEDNDVYETDENNDESEYIIRITLGSCSVSSTALVSANLESGGKAGENLIVKSTIVNSGTRSATYTVKAASYAEWANSYSVDQTTFTLDAGASKEVLLRFDVKEDVSGEKQFNIEVISGNEIVATQPVQVEIEGTSSWFAGITGNALEDSNKYLWGIGILNVVLIIFIIIVAIKVAKK